MLDQHSSAVPPRPDVFGPLPGGERLVWRGRCAVAEYAFDEAASLPRWTLPETTEVLVTDRRIAYAHATSDHPDEREITSGDLMWLWPQHLRVQPGARSQGRAAAAAQLQLVCAGPDDTFPALVFAGGDLRTVGDADRLANLIRHAIARFRLDNTGKLGLTAPQARVLSRLLIGPEFTNFQGGEGQTVSILGALPISRRSFGSDPAPVPDSHPAPVGETTVRVPGYRPGLAADEARALQAAAAEEETQLAQPDLASRAADLAARIASLVSATEENPVLPAPTPLPPRHAALPPLPAPGPAAALPEPVAGRMPAAAPSAADQFPVSDGPTTDLTARAERVRRAAARFAANSANTKASRRSDREVGSTTRGNRSR